MSKDDLILPRAPSFVPYTEGRENLVDQLNKAIDSSRLPQLKVFKLTPEAVLPHLATTGSACFDISACLLPSEKLKVYNKNNEINPVNVSHDGTVEIYPGERLLVPTGLILDIPDKYSVRLHPRSGLALKNGIILSNCEGVIDSDYVEPLFVIVTNTSIESFTIKHGDKICQGELVKTETISITETTEKPQQKTNRNGGFGSTGI